MLDTLGNLLLYILFSFLIVFQSLSPSIIESNKFFIQALIIAVLSSSSFFFLIFKLFKYEKKYVNENNLLIKIANLFGKNIDLSLSSIDRFLKNEVIVNYQPTKGIDLYLKNIFKR